MPRVSLASVSGLLEQLSEGSWLPIRFERAYQCLEGLKNGEFGAYQRTILAQLKPKSMMGRTNDRYEWMAE
jgi:hypothetical protein